MCAERILVSMNMRLFVLYMLLLVTGQKAENVRILGRSLDQYHMEFAAAPMNGVYSHQG